MIKSIFDEIEEEKPVREVKTGNSVSEGETGKINLPQIEAEESNSPETLAVETDSSEIADADSLETQIESPDFSELRFENLNVPDEQIEKINLPESEIEHVELSDEQIESLTAQIESLNLQETEDLLEISESRGQETFAALDFQNENSFEQETQTEIAGETFIQTETAAQAGAEPEFDFLLDSSPKPQTQERPERVEYARSQHNYKPESPVETIRKSGLAYAAAVVLFGSIVFMLVLGWFFDLLTGSAPWGMVGGIVLGSIIGFYQFFKLTSEILKNKD